MTKGPAMTREQAEAAIMAGIETVENLHEEGYRLIGAGEMGIATRLREAPSVRCC